MVNEELVQKIAGEVEAEWRMGGLSSGLYFDYALEIVKRCYEEEILKIKTIQELADLFKRGVLKEADGDVVLFDKSECALETKKDYEFELSYDEVAWQALELLGVCVSGV